ILEVALYRHRLLGRAPTTSTRRYRRRVRSLRFGPLRRGRVGLRLGQLVAYDGFAVQDLSLGGFCLCEPGTQTPRSTCCGSLLDRVDGIFRRGLTWTFVLGQQVAAAQPHTRGQASTATAEARSGRAAVVTNCHGYFLAGG